ncbi:hypothetical protein GDO81_025570 [Engystomops pustulosus]|uniref:Secreted protein n=1 Tax=Engystomops pustulosus TaxID=76066 RepID=A0AAV6YH45_ENGPU|nr:hypothetical protein GDO81_025570 [Engystomops pustulosus]
MKKSPMILDELGLWLFLIDISAMCIDNGSVLSLFSLSFCLSACIKKRRFNVNCLENITPEFSASTVRKTEITELCCEKQFRCERALSIIKNSLECYCLCK